MLKRMNTDKREKGFTMVEMVISVAFLAIISVFVVQFFISARNLSLKAHDIDMSVNISREIISTFKTVENAKELQGASALAKAEKLETLETMNYRSYFDEDWNKVDMSDADFGKKACFQISVVVNSPKEDELTGISITITRMKPYLLEKTKGNEIYSIDAEKYFGEGV
ncbi:MAG: prepilin-type N-terminal cleavage/methylation domain-containing protein [Clostridiales bacterium]|nr:prepilin-type N-terminal cleavage/methylation domain-containing protein [Clostridiales bacterium]